MGCTTAPPSPKPQNVSEHEVYVVGGANSAGQAREREPLPLETSLPGVFVAGDVRRSSMKRVASAVGEGAMPVSLAHQYLGTL